MTHHVRRPGAAPPADRREPADRRQTADWRADRPGPGPGSPEQPEPRPVVLPVGRHALLVELPTAEAAEAFHAELLRRSADGSLTERAGGVREIVPGARTVLLDGLPEPHRLAGELARWRIPPLSRGSGPAIELPVRYDGPDLADVAARWGVTPQEAARLHAATEFRVAFCGFAPGFGYLTGLPEEYAVPRRSDPRTRVPAGSVGLAGAYTGVYPRSSPGGWQLIGTVVRTALWDPQREPAALLTPGTRVRFMPEPAWAGEAGEAEEPEDQEQPAGSDGPRGPGGAAEPAPSGDEP